MRYKESFYSRIAGGCILQVSSPTARKAYEAGKTVYLLPANCHPDNSAWVSLCPVSKDYIAESFKYVVNSYKHYNCCTELGKYPIFFVAAE